MKKIMLLGILVLLSVFVFAAANTITTLISPEDNTYWILGGGISDNFTFYVNMTPSGLNGSLNCSVWANDTGTWANKFLNASLGAAATLRQYDFPPANLSLTVSDDQMFKWNAYCCDNATNCAWAGANRTIYVDDAPLVHLKTPADKTYSNTANVNINITVIGDSIDYTCYIYSNTTGTNFSQMGSFSTVLNNTQTPIQKTFSDGNYNYNAKCYENGAKYPYVYGWNLTNKTITIDTTVPVITINNSLSYAKSGSPYYVIVNLSVVDQNPDTCYILVNGTKNTTSAYSNATEFALGFNASDGNYNWGIYCNDSAGNSYSTGNYSVTIDTVNPYLVNYWNYSANACNSWTLELNLSEAANITAYSGTTVSVDNIVTTAIFSKNQTTLIPFNNSETMIYVNITACDRAGNCNTTIGTMPNLSMNSPVPLCTGWSLYSLYDSQINFSTLSSQTNADYVYWWNATNQSWLYYSSAATTYGAITIGKPEVIQIYTSTNKTWFRNNSAGSGYLRNFNIGHNFLGIYQSHTLGNISDIIFRNSSGGTYTPNGKVIQVDYLSSYNNTAQSWVSHIYNWTWNNATVIGTKNGLDMLWTYSNTTISVNITTNGHVYGNWS